MQFDLPFLRSTPPSPEVPETPAAEGIEFVRTPRARRYILRVKPDGTVRVTVPKRGSRSEAIDFVGRHLAWIAKQRARVRRDQSPVRWTHGSTILLDGQSVTITIEPVDGKLFANYGGRSLRVRDDADVRGAIEGDLRTLAAERLIPRLKEFAVRYGVTFDRVMIRNQRSRWGSCSRRGVIALNFRLVQMPPEVADYVLIHELMHLKQQNHGPHFWALVEQACPAYKESERWLRIQGRSLF